MKTVSLIILSLVSIALVGTAYGHGIGTESSISISDEREIKLTVELLPFDFYKSDQKLVKIYAYDQTNREAVTNTNFTVEIFDDGDILLRDAVYAED